MYIILIALTMFVCPIASIIIEAFVFKSHIGIVPLIGNNFVFWTVGIRIGFAGLHQAINPRFTAKQILGVDSDEPLQIVQELGFANLSIGIIGLATFFNGNWIVPAAIAGCLFYGLAGMRHIVKKDKNALELTATISDLYASLILLGYLTLTLTQYLA